MKKTYSLVLACAIGSCIATIVGVEFFSPLSWWGYLISIVSGCVVAYLIYDLEAVTEATGKAWKNARTPSEPLSKEKTLEEKKIGLRMVLDYYYLTDFKVGNVLWAFFGTLYCLIIDEGIFEILTGKKFYSILRNPSNTNYLSMLGILIVFFLIYLIACYCFAPTSSIKHIADVSKDPRSIEILEMQIAERKKRIGITSKTPKIIRLLVLNIFVLPIYVTIVNMLTLLVLGVKNFKAVVLTVLKGIGWALISPFLLLWIVVKFLWLLIKYIHNDNRLLCFFDTTLGGSIGLFFHSPLIGLMAGAIVGLISCKLKTFQSFKFQPKH